MLALPPRYRPNSHLRWSGEHLRADGVTLPGSSSRPLRDEHKLSTCSGGRTSHVLQRPAATGR